MQFTADLVRIPTVNPPGDEYETCARFVGEHLGRHGYQVEYFAAEGLPEHTTRHPRVNMASPGTYDHKPVKGIAGIEHCIAYGPGELEMAHQPDESCRIDDLVNATKAIAIATLDLMNRGR